MEVVIENGVAKKVYKTKNWEQKKARQQEYYQANKEKYAEARKRHRLKKYGVRSRKRLTDEQRAESANRRRKRATAAMKKRLATDPYFRFTQGIRSRVCSGIRRAGAVKSFRTSKLIGCSFSELREHLEEMFQPGMTWENHGRRGWHVDHIRPVASFDLRDPAQQRLCFHFSNLQPLWATDNLRKKAKWDGKHHHYQISRRELRHNRLVERTVIEIRNHLEVLQKVARGHFSSVSGL
jgi:hypothetical protein